MHIKRIHEMIECLTKTADEEFSKGIECVNTQEMGEVVDMIKDLCQAEYHAEIVKAMDEQKEEDEAEQKYLINMLKEEYGENDYRKHYDQYRYANGRFAPKGRGRRMGWEPIMNEPPYKHMAMDRDMDMDDYGRMYTGKGMSKYGYSHDEYMKEKQMHPGMDESSKRMRMDKLDEYLSNLMDMGKEMVQGMSPEEKQSWKSGITKLLNI